MFFWTAFIFLLQDDKGRQFVTKSLNSDFSSLFLREIAEANDLVGILSDASSDNTGSGNEVELYGLLGERCNDDRDCFLDYSDCHYDERSSSKRCQCRQGFIPTKNNVSCEPGNNSIL